MDIRCVLEQDKVIMAVKDANSLKCALASNKQVIFLLKSNIMTVASVVAQCKQAGKTVFVHLDLMEGIGKDEAAVEYVAKTVAPDGIISTKANLVKIAKAHGLMTVFRVFVIDSQGMETAFNALSKFTPTAVEIMPGIMGEITAQFANKTPLLIAGGLVSKYKHVQDAIGSGAIAVSTSNETLWDN